MEKELAENTASTNQQPEETGLTNLADNTALTNEESAIKEANERIAILTQEKENYRKGMMKYKNKLKDTPEYEETITKDDIEQLIDEKVKERLIESKINDAVQERDKLIEKIAKENSELKIALKNRPQSSTGSGSNQDKQEVKTEFWTKEQLDDFKKKGIDPNKVAENLEKVRAKNK